MKNLVGSTLGKYSIVALLGHGGMASVYKAHQPSLDRYVAIKVMHPHLAEDPNFVSRFEREAAAVARLTHPSIVRIYDFDADNGMYYMVMELIEGPTLKAEIQVRVQREQSFTHQEICKITVALAEAVEYAHSRGIIHRDIKPANVMLTPEGQVVLTDFGLAAILDRDQLTASGYTSGTPEYMSPEQIQGKPCDARSDIYSLGVLLYEIAAGRLPFEGDTPMKILLGHVMAEPLPPADLNPEMPLTLQAVILKAIRKEPDERYQSAADLAADLRATLGPERLGDTPVPVLAPQVKIESIADTDVSKTKVPRPYRGLFAFGTEDAPFFFGREVFIERLVRATRENGLVAVVGPSGSGKSSVVFAGLVPRLQQEGNWIIVDMRPGSHPFHALAAALLPALDPDISEADHLAEIRRMAEAFADGSLQLSDVVARILSHSESSRLLLIADQFEELYTFGVSPEVCRHFCAALLEAANDRTGSGSNMGVVLTLRADFMGQALADRAFADTLQKADVKLGPMTREELTQAIEQPALRLDVGFERGLVERILDDVGQEPGNLPLLEFALALLWDRRAGRRLTHAAYEAIGRVQGALARYAEKVYAGLSEEDKQRAHRVCTQLVRPGENTEDTRRSATRAELGEAEWLLVRHLADERLVVTGQNPAGQETVEVVHEALIRGWRRLREWMTADRDFRSWQERLRAALRQWEARQHDEAVLLRGSVLTEAEEWLIARRAHLSEAEQTFIQAGIALRGQEAAEREAQRLRELEAAHKLAETERRRAEEQSLAAQRLRQRALFLAGALLLAVLLAVAAGILGQMAHKNADLAATREAQAVANAQLAATREAEAVDNAALAVSHQAAAEAEAKLRATAEAKAVQEQAEAERQAVVAQKNADLAEQQRQEAEEQRQIAVSRQLAAQSHTVLAKQSDLALLLSLEANRLWDTAETRGSLVTSLQYDPYLVTLLHGHEGMAMWVAFSPDGKLLASAAANGGVRLWTVENVPGAVPSIQPKGGPLVGHDETQLVNAAVFSPDNRLLATASDDETIRIWDTATGKPVTTLDNGTFVQTIAFSPDGRLLASAGAALPGEEKVAIRLWDTATWQVTATLAAQTGVMWNLVFSPDGQTLATAGSNPSVMLWNVPAALNGSADSGRPLSYSHSVSWLAFSPDGASLVTRACSQSPQGFCIESQVLVWDVGTAAPVDEMGTEHEEVILSALFYGAAGQSLLTRGEDGAIRAWDLASGEMIGSPLPGRPAGLGCMALSPDQRLLAAPNADGTISVWDLGSPWPHGQPVIDYTGWASSVAYRPDGQQFSSVSTNGQITFHDGVTGEVQGGPMLHASPELAAVSALGLDPATERLIVGRADGTFTEWPLDTGIYTGYQDLESAHQYGQVALTFDSSGQWLVTGGVDGRLALWNAARTSVVAIMARHEGAVWAVGFNPATDPISSTLVSGDSQGKLLFWAAGPTLQLAVDAHESGVHCLAMSPDGQWVASGSEGGEIGVWSLATGELRRRLVAAHAGPVLALAFEATTDNLLSAGADGRVLRWDLAAPEGSVPTVMAQAEGGATVAAAVFHGASLAWGNADGQVQTWSWDTAAPSVVTTGQVTGAVTALAYDGRWLAAGCADGAVWLWDLDKSQAHDLVQTQSTPVSVSAVAYSPDGKTVASAGANGTILLWDVETRQPRRPPLDGQLLPAEAVAFDTKGTMLAASGCVHYNDEMGICDQTQVVVWDTTAWEPRARWPEQGIYTNYLAFSPNGSVLASAGCARTDGLGYCLQGQILLRDVATGELRQPLEAHTNVVKHVAFSPDGRLLASASYDRSVILWDVATGQQVGQRLIGHGYYALSVAFSPSGATLFSGGVRASTVGSGFQGELILWDVATGQQLGDPFLAHNMGAKGLAVSPDGRRLISVSYDGTVIVWNVDWDSWRERACQLANRNLTPEEWTQFFGSEPYRETCP